MATATPVRRTGSDGFDADAVRRVVVAATVADGVEPLNEAALLALRHRRPGDGAVWLAGPEEEPAGFAWLHGHEVELVVAPAARGRGVGTALADAVAHDVAAARRLTAWSHGNHPAAARLARRFGFTAVRDLWVMRRPLTGLPPLPGPADVARATGVAVRTFRPGQDEEAFLRLNAEAFAAHPEQGRLTRAGLEQRMAEPWFDPEGFFLAERTGGPDPAADLEEEQPADGGPEGGPGGAGGLLGFHWTKVHDGDTPVGEVYVVGVSPRAQGLGLGRLLTLTGLHHLAGRGLEEVLLYVEAGNAAAVVVYSRLGFTHAATDTHVMYAREGQRGASPQE